MILKWYEIKSIHPNIFSGLVKLHANFQKNVYQTMIVKWIGIVKNIIISKKSRNPCDRVFHSLLRLGRKVSSKLLTGQKVKAAS